MVHYIRFLRTPQVNEVLKKGLCISAVATVTTDLGDSFLGKDVDLVARLVDATRSGETLLSQSVTWQDGSRAVKLNLPCTTKMVTRLVRLHITTAETLQTISQSDIPAVLDVWSEPFPIKKGARTESLVERHLLLSNQTVVRQWEETGDSIARHIWDASLGFLMLFKRVYADRTFGSLPSLRALLTERPTDRLHILEVGAGCGIVGIALAQLRKSEMVLTDLEEAQSILQSNVDSSTPLAGSHLRRQILAWGPSIEKLQNPRYDLVLVSDCIYNPDSSLLLVETLLQVSSHNPKMQILVGFKRRHDADDIFFERMQAAGFRVAETCELALPHTMTEYDESAPQVEMFVYRPLQKSMPTHEHNS